MNYILHSKVRDSLSDILATMVIIIPLGLAVKEEHAFFRYLPQRRSACLRMSGSCMVLHFSVYLYSRHSGPGSFHLRERESMISVDNPGKLRYSFLIYNYLILIKKREFSREDSPGGMYHIQSQLAITAYLHDNGKQEQGGKYYGSDTAG